MTSAVSVTSVVSVTNVVSVTRVVSLFCFYPVPDALFVLPSENECLLYSFKVRNNVFLKRVNVIDWIGGGS